VSNEVEFPTVEEVASHPERAAGLPAEARAALLLRISAALVALSSGAAQPHVTPAAPKPPTDQTQLLTAEQVAERTGFARSYVYQLLRRGELRAVRRGKYVRVTEQALREWIDRHQEVMDSKLSTVLSTKHHVAKTNKAGKVTA